MQADFWLERWASNQLGFHQPDFNPLLQKHWSELDLNPSAPIFVPLCGKSLDMVWLRKQGHPIVGVELSSLACRDFFDGQRLDAECQHAGAFETWRAPGYTIHCGDFFALTADNLEGVAGVFDRASLVALPPEMRRRYTEHMTAILPIDTQVLLLTVEYDQREMKGPPHSVAAEEIRRIFGRGFEIEQLAAYGPSDPPAHFRDRGLRAMSEVVWRLRRQTAST